MNRVPDSTSYDKHPVHRDIRVVQVLYSLGWGGSEILGRDIVTGLHGQGFTCAVCALERGGEIERYLTDRSIPFFIAGRKPDEYFSVMLRIYRFFKEFKPHIVHTHHLHELFHSALGAKLVGASIIHTEHEYFSFDSSKARSLLRVLSHLCKHVTTVGEEITRYFADVMRIPQAKLHSISNGIDIEKFSPSVPASPEILAAAEGRYVVGTVARLEEDKDHLTLLRAFQEVKKSCDNCILVLVGDGSRRRFLEAESARLEIDQEVRFLGTRSDIPALLAAMDVFVLPSIHEGVPISLLEAMAMERPVIATSVGNIPKVIKNDCNGILIEPGNPSLLAEQIMNLLNEPQYAKSLGNSARQIIMESYDLKQTLKGYEELYKGVLEA